MNEIFMRTVIRAGAALGLALVGCAAKTDSAGGETFAPVSTTTFEYTRSEDFSPVEIGKRPRLSQETLLFAELLVKYGMFQNSLHYWVDRPLYFDRATRPEKMEYDTFPSFMINAEQLRRYMLDGFDVFANLKKNKANRLGTLSDWFVQGGYPELKILPIISYGEAIDRYGPNVPAFKSAVSTAQADPRFPRLGGKVLVPTYNYRLFKAEQHKQFFKDLTGALGNDDYVLCGQINATVLRNLSNAFNRNGRLTDAEVAELEASVREVLDVAGGIQLGTLERIREPEGPYCSYQSTDFFDRYVSPMVLRLLNEPKYAGKVLGYYVNQGYINNHSGHNHAEDGTSTLRRCLRSAIRTNPDYLLFFEWNELNENTMFQPTLWNGNTVGRLIRYHSRLLKGLAPDVYPGDDPSLPSLTLSYRATAKVGEVLDFEILNIPDGALKGAAKVQLQLFDLNGTRVAAFPVETIDQTKLGAVTYRTSTAHRAGGDVLVPELVVDGRRFANFHPIRIASTVSWNYKAVRQSLRDRLVAEKSAFAVRKVGENRYAYSADLAFGEKLASVELIADEHEQDAAGLAPEYDREKNEIVRLVITAPPKFGIRDGEIRVTVDGSKGCRYHNVWIANVDPGVIRPLPDNAGFKTRALVWSEELTFFVEVPKADVDKAKLTVDIVSKLTPCTPATVSVKTVLEKGIVGAVLNDSGVRVDFRRKDDQTDIPPHLKTTACAWSGETVTDVKLPVFHLRAVSESGRIWRSAPVRPEALPAADVVTFAAYDEYAHGRFLAKAPAVLVPEIDYIFDPATGAALGNTRERWFDAQLGGGFPSDQVCGDNVQPFTPGRREQTWVREADAWCLKFDGVNDYIDFPKETLPQGAFTLEMEVKPELPANDAPMTLFRHFDRVRGSISLFVRNGRLYATWGDKDLSKEPKFETGLAVKGGEWNAISVSYDFAQFVFTVNGQSKSFPWTGRAYAFKPSMFGGHDKLELSGSKVKPVYYKGLLRRLHIRHR